MVFGFLKKIFRKPKEVYSYIGTPEQYRKAVRKGVSWELAERTKEVMHLRKKLEERGELIKRLKSDLIMREEEEAIEQKRVLDKVKRAREFKIFFKPERPITMISSFTSEPFFGIDGVKRPYWVGVKFFHTPRGPYIIPLIAEKPSKGFLGEREYASLKTSPPIYLDLMGQLFRDPRTTIHKMKTSGLVEVNITPDGYFTGNQAPFRVKVKEVGREEKGKG